MLLAFYGLVWGLTVENYDPELQYEIKNGKLTKSHISKERITFLIDTTDGEYFFSASDGDLRGLEDIFNSVDRPSIELQTYRFNGKEKILFLKAESTVFFTERDVIKKVKQWKKSVYLVSFFLCLLGVVGFLFGDKLRKLDESKGS
ncbi:hypothetical protein JEU11_07455 [Paraglaciecola chathamensis]|uniref:Uncharacterized protein n=1 Tax=Paraglaciecola chathamensis TaxID=368405 RepID=A0ABS0WCS3_9ALTE|nr:hypothetical protein [Paraglaciecola chathamensis]MBJ2136284.1 hypothetical protein [Paraglaciecola chathamensis]